MTGATLGSEPRPYSTSFPARIAMRLVRGYQRRVSPLLGDNCRYHPTCSSYTLEAIGRFGLMRGWWLAVRRLARCHPFRDGGFDPVPERAPNSSEGQN